MYFEELFTYMPVYGIRFIIKILTILNLSTRQTMHVCVALSGCHFSLGGGSAGITNLLTLLLFTIEPMLGL